MASIESVTLDVADPTAADRFRLMIGGDAEPFTYPDGFAWEATSPAPIRPQRIQAWCEAYELRGRDLMRDGRWLG